MPLRPLHSFIAAALLAPLASAYAAPTCPLSYGSTDSAKSHKLYLYFPTASDSTYPANFSGESPAARFDVADLNSAIGTTAALRDRIHDVVVDDFCEFNVQVLQTTSNPETLPSPPALRHTEAVGSDNAGGGAWGRSPTSNADVLFGRVWAQAYVSCEGGDGAGGCSATGSLTGANATLDRWAQAIGGTAAHESGHTYGLNHSDDDPAGGLCPDPGTGPSPGEDAMNRHLMPSGCNLDGPSRATYRRHVSDRGFGILATNVGLSVQTMHNWDLVNPNAQAAHSLTMEFLSSLPAVNIAWSYGGATSPWINPVVSGPLGTATFHGQTLNRYRITWSSSNPAWPGSPGVVAGGGQFHIGATFTGVDFNAPDPIIIQNITLFDGSSHALSLHPRLPQYDAGSLDAADGSFNLHFFPAAGLPLQMQQATIHQLPRLAAIESMIAGQKPFTFDRQPITPWVSSECKASPLRDSVKCQIATLRQPPHVISVHRVGEPNVYDCSNGIPWEKIREANRGPGDSAKIPDNDGPICAASVRDPFPASTVYIVAKFVDPKAKHWDVKRRRYIVGPVTSTVYFQFAGVRNLRKWGEKVRHEEAIERFSPKIN